MRESEGLCPSLYRSKLKGLLDMKKGPIVEDVENTHRETVDGHEILDNSPVAIPVRFRRVDNITQKVQELVAQEFSRLAEQQGYESFEEADDFEVGDDYEVRSPYELDEEQIYYDHRNERSVASEERDADKGTDKETDGAQRTGKDSEEMSVRDTSDKRRVSKDGKVKEKKPSVGQGAKA